VAAVARPGLFLRLTKGRVGRGERVTVRILGARYIVQSGAGLTFGRPWVRDADAAIDLVHAATMVALAAIAPTHRRLALLSAATAIGFAAADLRERIRCAPGLPLRAAADAANFHQLPLGVVVPHTGEVVAVAVKICRRHDLPIVSRGGGTSLAGQRTNAVVVRDQR
jgi:hypothetical protein